MHKGQIGAKVTLTSTKNISGASSHVIRYRKPSGATGQWTATLAGTTDIFYTTQAGDADEAGRWSVQGYAAYPDGSDDFTVKATLPVEEIIEVTP